MSASDSMAPDFVENFSQYTSGQFPEGFKTYLFKKRKALRVYHVEEKGGQSYLHAVDDSDAGAPIARPMTREIKESTRFSWKWRALELPKSPSDADTACAVYLGFGGWTGTAIKYTWSTSEPAGDLKPSHRNHLMTLVKESGPRRVGAWQTVSIHVLEDYRKFFKKDPEDKLSGFAVLTDGDDSHSTSSCDYTNFSFSD